MYIRVHTIKLFVFLSLSNRSERPKTLCLVTFSPLFNYLFFEIFTPDLKKLFQSNTILRSHRHTTLSSHRLYPHSQTGSVQVGGKPRTILLSNVQLLKMIPKFSKIHLKINILILYNFLVPEMFFRLLYHQPMDLVQYESTSSEYRTHYDENYRQ